MSLGRKGSLRLLMYFPEHKKYKSHDKLVLSEYWSKVQIAQSPNWIVPRYVQLMKLVQAAHCQFQFQNSLCQKENYSKQQPRILVHQAEPQYGNILCREGKDLKQQPHFLAHHVQFQHENILAHHIQSQHENRLCREEQLDILVHHIHFPDFENNNISCYGSMT